MTLFFLLLLACGLSSSELYAQYHFGRAGEMYEYANQYKCEGRLSIALEHADEAIRLREDFLDAYLLRASITEAMDDLKSANTDYAIVLHLDPEHSAARFQRAVNYFKMDRFQDARQDFYYLLNHPSGETTKVYFKGKSGPGGFEGTSVTSLQSDMRADIFNYLGLSHLYESSLDSAAHYIDSAISRSSREPDYYVNRGLLHEARNDTLAAVADYQLALSYRSDHADALANLYKLSRNSDYDQLLEETYDLAVKQQGSHQAYYNRAIYHQGNEDHRKAIRDFDRALAIAKTDDEALVMRAYSKEHAADLQGALHDYNQALRLNPMLAQAYSNRANVFYKLKKYKAAIDDYNRAIAFFPDNPRLFYNRGLALYMDGQRTDACIDLHMALDMGFVHARAPIRAYCQD